MKCQYVKCGCEIRGRLTRGLRKYCGWSCRMKASDLRRRTRMRPLTKRQRYLQQCAETSWV